MKHRQVAHLAALVVAHLMLAWPLSVLQGQPSSTASRKRALEASGAHLSTLFKHAVEIAFVDSLASCVLSGDVPADCTVGTASDRFQHEEVRAALERGFGKTKRAASFEALLAIRANNARAAAAKGGSGAACGGPSDSPLATFFTISGMTFAKGTTVTTLVAHDLTSLGGCPSGITIFEVTDFARSNGTFVAEVKAVQHFEGRPEGARTSRR